MNYAHDFHAGNFADVLKHVILVRALIYLRRKETAFRIIDTHGGGGLYDLADERAERTGEWRAGILRLLQAATPPEPLALLQPYLDIVAPLMRANPPLYPGSPLIAAALLRRQDRLIACELQPQAAARLKQALALERRGKAIELDGYTALSAFVPPPERRGLALIDPPFEDAGEFARLARELPAALRKWPTGVFMLWMPVKDVSMVASFARRLADDAAAAGARGALRLDLQIGAMAAGGPLTRTALLILNPPFALESEARLLLPALASAMGGDEARFFIESASFG